SPLPHYFIGGLYVRSAFWSKAAWTSDAVRDEAHRKAALSYSRAIELDPKFLDAYVQRANAYYQLKQSRQAVKDYDQALQLDPENESAYHDRALAKMDLGEYYSAISDFSDSIRRKKETSDSLFSKLAYENRADAYMKVGDYSSAISDLDKAIERELANDSFLMNLRTFRLIYPEYEQLPDAALVEKVRVLFWPGFTHEVLSKQLTENKDFTSTGLADLYVKRGDAYLRAKDFRKAGAEYNRAFAGFGEYGKATDRWRLFASPRTDEFYIDVKTLDFGESGPARLWMKVVSKKPTYSIDAYEVDCKARRLNQVSTAIYDSSDNLVRTNELLDGWQRIIPDTIGEDLYAGMCSRP
ncbi:MAG: surface-adhesin E family protein, partial [Bryobacteraceae bacterium]